MPTIEQALMRLNGAVSGLETNVDRLQNALKGRQRDMFAFGGPKCAGSASPENTVITRRLDRAIQKIEELLGEGSAG